MNGTFQATLATPVGLRKGIVRFVDDNGRLSGSIRALGRENPFAGGKFEGDSFEFSGVLKIGFHRFVYTARGSVVGDTLSAVASTSYGELKLNGTRIREEN